MLLKINHTKNPLGRVKAKNSQRGISQVVNVPSLVG